MRTICGGALLLSLLVIASNSPFAGTRYNTTLRRALKGNLRAAFATAVMLLSGDGGAQRDPAAAVEWFRRCADDGDAKAQTQLGYMYAQGIGVPADRAEARRWFLRAAAAGYPPAQFDLGMMNLESQDSLADIGQALYWLTRAAEKGHKKAQMNLGLLYAEGRPGLTQDTAVALKWMRVAAKQHYICAQYNLAVLYRTRARPDEREAMRWFQRAAHHYDQRGQAIDVIAHCTSGLSASSHQRFAAKR